MYPIPAKVLTVAKQYRSKLSEMPDPEWYLKQFRSHVGKIHELFKVCPPQRWKALSSSIGAALAEVGEKSGVKAGHHIQTEDMSRKEPKALRCSQGLIGIGFAASILLNRSESGRMRISS